MDFPTRCGLAICIALAVAHASAAPDAKRAAECQRKVNLANKNEMIYQADFKTAELIVYVGPTYFMVPIDVKQGLAAAISCVVVQGDSSKVAEFSFRHWQTGRLVAKYRYGRLEVD